MNDYSTASNYKGDAETEPPPLTSSLPALQDNISSSGDESGDQCKNYLHPAAHSVKVMHQQQQTDLGNASAPIKISCRERQGYKSFCSQSEDISLFQPQAAGIISDSCSTRKSSLQFLSEESKEGGRPSKLVNGAITNRLTLSLPRERRRTDIPNH